MDMEDMYHMYMCRTARIGTRLCVQDPRKTAIFSIKNQHMLACSVSLSSAGVARLYDFRCTTRVCPQSSTES